MTNPAVDAAGNRMEKFASPPSRLFGIVMLVLAALGVAAILATTPERDIKAVFLILVIAICCWVALVRPTISAHANGVLVHNMVRDVFVPWSRIDRVRVLHTVQIVTDDDERYHGLGISRSTRQIVRRGYGRTSLMSGTMSLGFGNNLGDSDGGSHASPVDRREMEQGMVYQDYVEARLEQLALDAAPSDLKTVVTWSYPALALLAVAVVLMVLLLV